MSKFISSYNIPVITKAIRLMERRKTLFVAMVLGLCTAEIVGSVLYSSGIRGAINSLSGVDWFTLMRYVILFASRHIIT